MNRNLVVFSLFLLALTIGMGAFGAHALKKMVNDSTQQSFEIAVRYQFYGTLVLLILGFHLTPGAKHFRFWLCTFGLGMALFSGSIYGMVLGAILQMGVKLLGPITPIGGALMILSLIMLGIQFARNRN